MTALPPSPPFPPAPSTRVDSGEHPPVDGHLTMRFGKKARISIPLSGAAKYFVIPILTAIVPLVFSLRAATRSEVKAEVTKKADEVAQKTEKVREETAKPIDNHADELARTRAELARLAAIVDFYEQARKAAAGSANGLSPPRRRRDPKTEKKAQAAAQDLKIIQARVYAPAPLRAPDAPKAEGTSPATAVPVMSAPKETSPQKPRDAGGASP